MFKILKNLFSTKEAIQKRAGTELGVEFGLAGTQAKRDKQAFNRVLEHAKITMVTSKDVEEWDRLNLPRKIVVSKSSSLSIRVDDQPVFHRVMFRQSEIVLILVNSNLSIAVVLSNMAPSQLDSLVGLSGSMNEVYPFIRQIATKINHQEQSELRGFLRNFHLMVKQFGVSS